MKNVTICIILSFLTQISCQSQVQNEYWIGEIRKLNRVETILLKQVDGGFIDYFINPSDTIRDGKKNLSDQRFIQSTNSMNLDLLEVKYNRKTSKLDTLRCRLRKATATSFAEDLIEKRALDIDLPVGNGQKSGFGNSIKFINPLFLTKMNGNIMVQFHDTIVDLNDPNIYEVLLGDREIIKSYGSDKYDRRAFPVIIIADKEIKVGAIKNIESKLNLCMYRQVIYLLESPYYLKANYIAKRRWPWSKDQSLKNSNFGVNMPRVYSKERTYLPLPRPGLDVLVRNKSFVEYKEGKYYFNGKEVDKDELIQLLKEKLRADKQTVISYFVSGDSSYQEYVDVEGLIQNAIWDVKEEYIVKNFDKSVEYEELSKKDELFQKVNGKLYYISYEIDSKGELKELRAFNKK